MRLRLTVSPHKNWDLDIPEILFNTCTRRNAATGLIPSEVLFGENLRRPGEWTFPTSLPPTHQSRDARIQQVRRDQAKYLNSKVPKDVPEPDRNQQYQSGDQVFIRNHELCNAR